MSAAPSYTDVTAEEAEALVAADSVCVLDVRSPGEYRDLGHIPGSLLLPVDLVASGAATLPRDGKPLLVCCEHGVRSAFAAGLLARAGFPDVRNLSGGMSVWRGPRVHSAGDPFGAVGPSSWLVENGDLLPRGGAALDLACGRGRHALLLAAAGLQVRAVDIDAGKVADLAATAERLGMPVIAEVLDLESGAPNLGSAAYELIVGFRYLHRPLFPALAEALKPGGLLLYETFTTAQAESGHPVNRDFLLEAGELSQLVSPLEVVRSREGEHDGAQVAGVAARRT